ncbi:GTP 3',8-cyclase MoaA [uncultured Desulfosarcina sp.]|uniref:GTP 3',8-cyclase MoaA n=1 Tax=uncultured Desulfosarcina sp. TaxID=218289 RepID=UPI0029C70C09|nr:GTP 3',8-cyclase MoaA [uncultured Desulfosarcina sp.]
MANEPNKDAPFAEKLVDREKRHLNYLRVSITDRCNLRCLYCAPEGRIPKLGHDDILSYEEILRLVRIGIRLGIRKIRITGGEPLVRKGAVDLLRRLVALPELEDVSLTTNGVLLASKAQEIYDAGVRRINISLDSLVPEKFAQITGYDRFERVWAGIERAHEIGFSPIKINVVAMRGINDDEILDLGRLSIDHPFHIRFIEYMPIGNSRTSSRDQLLTPEIRQKISRLGDLIPVENHCHDGPAKRYRLAGARGEIGFISALSQHFCSRCNRLRLTADGKLRACLLSDRHESLKEPLRGGASDEALAEIFRTAVRRKAARHHLALNRCTTVNDQMQGIGG